MKQHRASWLQREKAFAAFATGPLLDFWHSREECEFTGVENLTLRYVRFISPQHKRVIVIVPGRIESYVKYPELAYDLFHCGFDVIVLDHRGQGRSDRLLDDSHLGHVVEFSHYVDDLETLYLKEIVSRHYQQRYALAHSMGGRNSGPVPGASAWRFSRCGSGCADVWHRAAVTLFSGA